MSTNSNLKSIEPTSRLLGLPPELRDRIWHYALQYGGPVQVMPLGGEGLPPHTLALLATCSQIYNEAWLHFYGEADFDLRSRRSTEAETVLSQVSRFESGLANNLSSLRNVNFTYSRYWIHALLFQSIDAWEAKVEEHAEARQEHNMDFGPKLLAVIHTFERSASAVLFMVQKLTGLRSVTINIPGHMSHDLVNETLCQ